jgi:nucleoside-diphosphate-sugar epimerase
MKILVTGATGFLGSRIIEQLATFADVDNIIAAGRIIKTVHEVRHDKIEYKLGDLTDADYVQSIVEGIDKVVNCASLSSPFGSYQAFKKANIDTQKLLIEACEKAKIKRFVYISTPSIYNNYQDRFNIKETDDLPNELVNNYAVTKLEAEKLLATSTLSYVTLRPRALIGRGDTIIMPRLIKAFKEGRLRIIGDGKNIVDLTAVANVVDAVWLALNAKEENCKDVYNITNDDPVNLWDNIRYVLNGLGFELSNKSLTINTAMTIARMMEFISKLTKREPTLMKYSVGTLANSLTMDISKAKRKLGYQPKMTTKQAIDEFLQYYKTENP